jgi:hypothetical protein
MKKAALIGIVFLIVIVGAIWYATPSSRAHRVEVCMEFKGMTSCGSASGETERNALRAATSVACATIASGVTDSMACDQATPKKVTWLK